MKYLLLFLVVPALCAQQVIPLWQGPAPGSENWMQQEVNYKNARGEAMVRNVVNPTLTVYLPENNKATGTAVIIAPGGGFRFLSWDSEGVFVAKWLAARGVAAFVLKYRVVESPAPEAEYQTFLASFMASLGKTPANQISPEIQNLAAEDCRQAVTLLRQRSEEFAIRANRIVLMGFSAGAIATVKAVMNPDAAGRPDYIAPIYGGATNGSTIPKPAPPAFILVANDDRLMSVASAKLYADWKAADIPVEFHVYAKGGHGFGLTPHGLPVDNWIDLFGAWLGDQGLMKR